MSCRRRLLLRLVLLTETYNRGKRYRNCCFYRRTIQNGHLKDLLLLFIHFSWIGGRIRKKVDVVRREVENVQNITMFRDTWNLGYDDNHCNKYISKVKVKKRPFFLMEGEEGDKEVQNYENIVCVRSCFLCNLEHYHFFVFISFFDIVNCIVISFAHCWSRWWRECIDNLKCVFAWLTNAGAKKQMVFQVSFMFSVGFLRKLYIVGLLFTFLLLLLILSLIVMEGTWLRFCNLWSKEDYWGIGESINKEPIFFILRKLWFISRIL